MIFPENELTQQDPQLDWSFIEFNKEKHSGHRSLASNLSGSASFVSPSPNSCIGASLNEFPFLGKTPISCLKFPTSSGSKFSSLAYNTRKDSNQANITYVLGLRVNRIYLSIKKYFFKNFKIFRTFLV